MKAFRCTSRKELSFVDADYFDMARRNHQIEYPVILKCALEILSNLEDENKNHYLEGQNMLIKKLDVETADEVIDILKQKIVLWGVL